MNFNRLISIDEFESVKFNHHLVNFNHRLVKFQPPIDGFHILNLYHVIFNHFCHIWPAIHMSTLLSTIKDLMIETDNTPCDPKYKLLLYHRFVLSKLSWHLTIADLGKTWVIDTLANIVASYVRKWLELPISATISSLILNKYRYGVNLVLPSTKFIECQTVIRNA